MFVSKDNNLNKAHIKYIENRLYEAADEVGRYKLENSNTPTRSTISEPDEAEMEEFIANIKLLYIQAARGANARGISTTEGFVVLKNSRIADSVTRSFPDNYLHLRDKLLYNKAIVQDLEGLVLTRDLLFSSPSTAASIVMGRSANGLAEWKTKDGRILKSLEETK